MREGKILSWGVSNFDVPDLDAVRAIAGDGHLACDQVLYHLRERAVEHAVIPWCERHAVAVVAYSPLGSGHFPGSAHEGRPAAARDRRRSRGDAAPGRAAVPRAATVALRDPQVGDPEHTAENAVAGDLRLSAAEMDLIDEAFPRGPRPRELPML